MRFLRRATKRCARRGTSSDARCARTGARLCRPHAPGRPRPFSLPAAPTGPCCAVPSLMPDRNNTNQPRSNSFRRFCTAEVAARQSSRHLAYMQGARIKACGSFPPQIVLALTPPENLPTSIPCCAALRGPRSKIIRKSLALRCEQFRACRFLAEQFRGPQLKILDFQLG